MRIDIALMIATLVLASLASSCATRRPTTPTAPACVFIDRCWNPALTTPGG